MKEFITIAQDVAIPNSPTTIIGIGGLIVAAVTAVWGWFRAELNDCKKDRKDLYARVDQLHVDFSALSMRVGQAEQKITKTGGA
jgi:hypothetical protein